MKLNQRSSGVAVTGCLGSASAFADRTAVVTDSSSLQETVARNPSRRLHVPSGRHALTNAVIIDADDTELQGLGTWVPENPGAAIIEVRAHRVRPLL